MRIKFILGFFPVISSATVNLLTFGQLQSTKSIFKYPISQLFNCNDVQELLPIDVGTTPNKKSCKLLCNGKFSSKLFSKLLSENYEYIIKLNDNQISIPIGDPNTVIILFLDDILGRVVHSFFNQSALYRRHYCRHLHHFQ